MGQREPPIVIPELRQLARGKPCQFEIPDVCNHNPETTVLCHSNSLAHGKGVGVKSHDVHSAFGCSACHAWYDNATHKDTPREEKQYAFRRARDRTWEYLARNGHLKILP